MKLQSYEKQPVIDGVKIIDLVEHYDDSGTFNEVLRLSPIRTPESLEINSNVEGFNFSPEIQVNFSTIQPLTTKGFHCHFLQRDLWYLPSGNRCIINLIDIRDVLEFSKENELDKDFLETHRMRVVMGVKPQLLLIPAGVLHGISNPSLISSISMLYFVDQYFNSNDEFRIPYDVIGEEIWKTTNG